jgi:hypothetical protein
MSETLGTDARALIDQATGGDEPSSADRDRVRARLALALVATTGTFAVGTAKIAAGSLAPATTAAAAPAAGVVGTVGAVGTAGAGAGVVTAASVGVGMKVVLGVVALVAVAGAGGVAVSQRRASVSPPAVASVANANAVAAAAVPVSPVAPVALAAPAPAPAPASASAPALELDDPPSSAVVPATSAPHASAASATPDVAEELVLLREARSALKAGDPARSLQLLAEHAHRFPHGALTEEREAARAVASCARADSGGSADEARAAVARFFRAYPRSLHASRVHAACDAIDAH